MENKVVKRETNIELLRILAMFMVIIIHAIVYGEIQDVNKKTQYISVNFLLSLVLAANTLFLLISGYYGAKSKFNLKKILRLIGKALFYSIAIYFVAVYIRKDTLSKELTYLSFFPILGGSYWFISAYVALYFFSPILKVLILKLNKNQFKYLLILLTVILGFVKLIFNPAEMFSSYFSYAIWVYLIGAYISLYVEPKKEKGYYVLKYFVTCIILTILICSFMFSNSSWKTELERIPNHITTNLKDFSNVFSVLCGVFIFLKFRTIKIDDKWLIKIISLVSGSVFSIYLIHDHLANRYLWAEAMKLIPYENNAMILCVCIIGFATIGFITFLSIDLIRRACIFLIRKISFIDKCFIKIANVIDRVNIKINNFLNEGQNYIDTSENLNVKV